MILVLKKIKEKNLIIIILSSNIIMTDNKTLNVEMSLGSDSVIQKILETGTPAEDGLKAVETDFSDEEYNKMMADFLQKMRLQAEKIQPVTNKEKIQSIREQLADGRRPLKFRKGFLNVNHNSIG
jgi:hypothetical protein